MIKNQLGEDISLPLQVKSIETKFLEFRLSDELLVYMLS